jgi:glucose-6-phosphate 1-dehydrogenase
VKPPNQAIVVFGASGDLTKRKIIPAFYNLAREGMMPDRYRIIGYARSEMTDAEFVEHARKAVEEFSRSPLEDHAWKAFSDSLHFLSGSFDTPDCMKHLKADLERADTELQTDGRRLYYCATPPAAFPQIAERVGEIGPGSDPRIVIEKPFGVDLESARALNRTVHAVFSERQVFRIDHYLGKETVQNILVFRFANSMFERVWNRDAIDHIQITVAESLGVEGRGAYYESSGALRDIVQNHILQVLAFLTMEPPRSLGPRAIHEEKVKLLEAVRPFKPEDVVRAQYERGTTDGERVPGYTSEEGVSTDSNTETYAAIRAHIDNWRWSGVPFYLRTGKRLKKRATEINVFFKDVPAYLFDQPPAPNHLSIRIQPEEGVSFAFEAKEPGPGFVPRTVDMDFGYHEFFGGAGAIDAYERLLTDAMSGDNTLFTRADAVERSWEVVEPILKGGGNMYGYAAGSWGPRAADELIAPRRWHRL